MNTPPLLLGAALLSWGWFNGCPAVAAGMAVLLESSRVLPMRWELAAPDFARLWRLCLALAVMALAYALTGGQGPQLLTQLFAFDPAAADGKPSSASLLSTLVFFQWLPLTFFPLVLAQAYSRQRELDPALFSWLLRSLPPTWRPRSAVRPGVNTAYPYLAGCLLAASIGQAPRWQTFPALTGLLVWALWSERPRRFALPLWLLLAGLAAGLGYTGDRGLQRLYEFVQNYNAEWLSNLVGGRPDTRESRTAIGRAGRLKLSGKIVLRLQTPDGQPPPGLLREASYHTFKSPLWLGDDATSFQPLNPEPDETTWRLTSAAASGHVGAPKAGRTLTLAGHLRNGSGLLALPQGVEVLGNLPALSVQTNRLGGVHVEDGPGFFAAECHYVEGPGIDSPPTPEDLEIPLRERPVVTRVCEELGLTGQTPAEVTRTVSAFFQARFRYRLDAGPPPAHATNLTPVGTFLLHDRAGHCEYFATATALLLRQANIPTRYAVGYAVQERAGRQYVVRERHAHAWCLAHLHGTWHQLDTTPGDWAARDAAQASPFQTLTDFWSRIGYEFNRFRYGQSGLRRPLGWLTLGVVLASLAPLFLRRRTRRGRAGGPGPSSTPDRPGADSEFYRVEQALAGQGYPRHPGENLTRWSQRLPRLPDAPEFQPSLAAAVALHQRHRFDPQGLRSAPREELRARSAACLAALRRTNPGCPEPPVTTPEPLRSKPAATL